MTHAMEMVAASKLKKLQDLLKQSDRYIGELKRILGTLVNEKPLAHSLLEKRKELKSILAFLIASDTGLCGSYNTNMFEQATRFLNSPHPPPPNMGGGMEGSSIHFVTIGRQAAHFLRRRKQTIAKEVDIPRPQEIEQTVHQITQIATQEFQSGQADQVVFIYTKVFSLGSMRPATEQLFPIVSSAPHPNLPPQRGEGMVDYIIEPSLQDILDAVLPEFIEAQVAQFIKNALVAEQAARMMAMRQATDNAEEMIESLTLARNKARQASITKELIEVVSGSRTLQMK